MPDDKDRTKLKRRLRISALVVLFWIVPMFFGDAGFYWRNLHYQSFSDTCLLVFEKSIPSLLFAGCFWVGGIYYENREQWRPTMIIEGKKALVALKFPLIAFVVLFAIHLFVITPAKINLEQASKIKAMTDENSKQQEPQRIAITVADDDARKEIERLKKENSEQEKQIRELREKSPIRRILSEEMAKRIAAYLIQSQPGTVSVHIFSNDAECIELADQLIAIFTFCKFKVRDDLLMFDVTARRGVRFKIKSDSDLFLMQGLRQFFNEIGQMELIETNKNLEVDILVEVAQELK